ncbi:endonuclease/exonuclease/phosphatase family protein [Bacteroidota bacterium]
MDMIGGKIKTRRKQVSDWIQEQEPSMVALQELCKYTPDKLQEDANVWGHPYSVLLKEDGYSVGLTSAFPIELKEKIRDGMWHGALHCVTNGIDVFVIHLSPASYRFRQKETEILLEKLKIVAENQDNYVVLGDFNSLSPIDADMYNFEGAMFKRMVASQKKKGEEGNLNHGKPDFSVMSAFLAFPLNDVCQPFTKGIKERGSFPGQVLGEINNETEDQLNARLAKN